MTLERLGPYTLALSPGCFPLGEESLALGQFATVRHRWKVCDLGCGGGTLLLLLARRALGLTLTGVEVEAEAAQCARDNLEANGLAGEIFTADLRGKRVLPNEGFELVVSNPPWFSLGAGAFGGRARSEETCTLGELCAVANRLLKTGGHFALVHRPERLADLLCTLRSCRLEAKRLQYLTHALDKPPSAVMVEGVKNGRPGIETLPMLIRQAVARCPDQLGGQTDTRHSARTGKDD